MISHRAALIVQDRWSSWLQGFACPTKSQKDTVEALKRFLGPQTKCKHIFTDNSEELRAASRELGIDHDKSRPHRPQTNGVAERAVRRVKEGTSCALVQSGWNESYWPEAMNCFCFLRNAVDVLITGETAWEKRFGVPFKGKILPFGCEINYKPITDKDAAKTHQFGAKMLPGIFMGYKQKSGGGWSGDVFICDSDEIKNASRFSDIYIKDFAQSEVQVVLVNGEPRFPLALGELKQPEPAERRAPTPKRSTKAEPSWEPDQGEASKGTITTEVQDKEADPQPSGEVDPIPVDQRDYWVVNEDTMTRYHKQPRFKLFMPDEVKCPLPLKYI